MAWKDVLVLSLLGWASFTTGAPQKADASASISAPPLRSYPTAAAHTPYSGSPKMVGALNATSVGKGVSSKPAPPAATTYPSDGKLHMAQPGPYIPGGGLGTNGTTPVYNAKSDYDYESLALALYQEWLELDLFQDGLNRFSEADFRAAGLTAADRYLIQFMAEQSLGHVTMISNMLGAKAPQKCNYVYPFRTVREFVDFCQKLTRFGEAGVYGFLPHLNSREAAALMLQTIATGARQQVIFRQFEGLFPMPVWFEVGVPQSWAWSLLAPYIASCPAGQTRLAWQNFPALRIMNQPNPARVNASSGGFNDTLGSGVNALNSSTIKGSASCLNSSMVGNRCNPAITRNRTTPLSYPGRRVYLKWDSPGQSVGPNNSYITSTMGGKATYVVWVSQLNVTYSPLTMTGPNAGITTQPNLETYVGDPAINGTLFIAIADKKVEVTPFNMSMVNPHIVAGPALYQAG